MPSIEKILEQVLRGTADANVEFNDLRRLLSRLGFENESRTDIIFFAERACLR